MKAIALIRAPTPNRDSFFSWSSSHGLYLTAYYIYEHEPGHFYHSTLSNNHILKLSKNIVLKKFGWCPDIKQILKNKKNEIWIIYGYNSLTMLYAIFYLVKNNRHFILRTSSTLLVRRNILRLLLKNIIVRYICKKSSAILGAGKANIDYFKSLNIDLKKIFIAPVPIPIWHQQTINEKKEVIKQNYNINENLVILFVGRLEKIKGVQDLIIAFSKIYKKYNACLLIVGDGSYRKKLEKLVSKKSIRNVYFMGYKNKDELQKIYSISDIFVLPSSGYEFWGWVVAEAMSFGLPVIVSNIVGAAYDIIFHGKNGFIFNAKNVNELAYYLEILLSKPDLRKEFGDKCKEIIKNISFYQKLNGFISAINYTKKIDKYYFNL